MRDIVIGDRGIELSVYTNQETSTAAHEPQTAGLSLRKLPALVILDAENRVVMYNDSGAEVMRSLYEAPTSDLVGALPVGLQKSLDSARTKAASGNATFVPIAIDLFARISVLRGERAPYTVLTFERPRSRDMTEQNFRRFRLTAREREVAMLLLRGISNRRIAHRLHLAENTVQCHLKTIFMKCGVHTRLAFAAKMHGFADDPEPAA